MKRKICSGIIVLMLIVSIFSCKKIIASIFSGLEFNLPNMSVNIPAVPIVTAGEVQFGTITQNINLDSVVKANTGNSFGADVVKAVSIKSITITIPNADDLNNLSNFQSARISLTSNSNSTSIDIANINFPDTNASTFVYTPASSTELVTYLKGSSLTYTLYGRNRRITTKTLTFTESVRLKVN